MSSMIVAYAAGPFRGETAWEIECNIRRAEELGAEIVKLGHMVVIPHANTRWLHGTAPDSFFLEGTLELLRRCDCVVLTADWIRSSGARGEVEEAHKLGIPVFTSLDAFRRWAATARGRRPRPPKDWPYGPPERHQSCCVLYDGEPECDCAASDASNPDFGRGA